MAFSSERLHYAEIYCLFSSYRATMVNKGNSPINYR